MLIDEDIMVIANFWLISVYCFNKRHGSRNNKFLGYWNVNINMLDDRREWRNQIMSLIVNF